MAGPKLQRHFMKIWPHQETEDGELNVLVNRQSLFAFLIVLVDAKKKKKKL